MTVRATDTVYVIFQDRPEPAWWYGFCAPGFRHVWVLAPTYWPERGLAAHKTTIKIEPTAQYFNIEHWNSDPERSARLFADDPDTTIVLSVRVTLPPHGIAAIAGLRGVMTCVSLIKYVLGLRAWWVWTPKALCDYLIRHRKAQIVQPIEVANHDSAIQKPAEA